MPTHGQDLVGARIRDLRRQRGMSQAQLAHPELSDSYVSLIESGKRSPTQAVIQLLAAKLDCSPTYLINGVTAERLSELEIGLRFAQLALENGEAGEARQRFEELLENEQLAALDQLRSDAEFGYALALEASGDLTMAVKRLRAMLTAGEASTQRRIAMQIALCRCLRETGDLSESIQTGEHFLAQESSNGWNDDVVQLGATVLAAYIHRGDRVRSIQLAERLLAIAESLGTARAIVAACWNGSTVFSDTGDSKRALALVERALAIQAETGDTRNLARLRSRYGMHILWLSPKETERARALLREAKQQLAETSASPVDREYCTVELANAETMLGHPEEAVRLLSEPSTVAVADGADLLAMERHLALARAFQVLVQPAEATAALASAADLLQEMRASRRAAEAWFELAEQLEALDDFERSKITFQRALACAGL